MNPAPGIVGFAYAAMAQARLDHLKAMMDAVIAAELTFMVPILKSLMVLFVARQFLMMQGGYLEWNRFVGSILRAGIVIFLITHSGAFAQTIRDPLFTKIPAAISSTILGSVGVNVTSAMGPAQQFDQVALQMDQLTARTLEVNTSWSATSIANSLAAHTANGGAQTVLGLIAGVWMCGVSLLAILLCFGPVLLVFELFDRTRGFVDQWVGKIIGIIALGMGTSILLALQMQELNDLLRTIHGSIGPNTNPNASEAVGMLVHVFANLALDLLLMLSLPVAVTFGSSAAQSLMTPALLAMRGAGGAANLARQAAMDGARKGAGGGGRGANTVSR